MKSDTPMKKADYLEEAKWNHQLSFHGLPIEERRVWYSLLLRAAFDDLGEQQ